MSRKFVPQVRIPYWKVEASVLIVLLGLTLYSVEVIKHALHVPRDSIAHQQLLLPLFVMLDILARIIQPTVLSAVKVLNFLFICFNPVTLN